VLGLTISTTTISYLFIFPALVKLRYSRPEVERPNDNLAALSFSHQRLQYELTQIVPLAVIVGVGVVFYLLGGKTRRETAAEPVAPVYVPADDHEPAP
jgi:glutamate:GABA antiporter